MSPNPQIRVEESRDLAFFDQVLNSEGVYETAADDACPPRGQMSVEALARAGNIFLKITADQTPIGYFGLIRVGPGLYEVHTLILPEHRRWALRATKVGKAWMFCSTDALVLSTCAWTHAKNVRWLTAASGMKPEAVRRHVNTVKGAAVARMLYTLTLPEWVRIAEPDYRAEGRQFHQQLAAQLGAELSDENREGMTGLFLTMALMGQPEKAQSIFNRWAQIHGFSPVQYLGQRGTGVLLEWSNAVVVVKPGFETVILERRK